MRHLKKVKKLGLCKSHRKSLVRNLITSLVLNERIRTTESRAKALAARFGRLMRVVRNKEKREAIRLLPQFCFSAAASKKIIEVIKPRYENKLSGFTRITPVSLRKGDNAKLVQIELI